MDPNQTVNQTPSPAPESVPATPTSEQNVPQKSPSKKLLLLIGGGVVVIITIILILFVLTRSTSKPEDTTKPITTKTSPAGNLADVKKKNQSTPTAQADTHIMVYGAWTGQTSVIKAVDLSNANNFLIATLPLNIKKVSIIDPSTLLYIDQTDDKDHGKRITIYDIKNKAIKYGIPAADGYVIDDYLLSPNKKYITLWEVSLAPDTQILQGGKSRVYIIDLTNPSISNLLFDENVDNTIPVHYPRAILDDGTLLTDTFMANDPNGGTGWAYGMSTVDFDGTNRKTLDTMQAGTYSTQPVLSTDGKYLLFSGYDGSKGDGNAIVNGYRQAVLTPNTVELLNTQTLQRFRLPNIPSDNTYSQVSWDSVTGNIIVTELSADSTQSGIYIYDLAAQTLNKLSLPDINATPYGYISQLPNNKTLIATSDDKPSNLGNLGDNYAYALTQLSIIDKQNNLSNIAVQDPFIQYITMLPGNYFKSVLGVSISVVNAKTIPTMATQTQNVPQQNLQLNTFFLKADLASTRLLLQSTPSCTLLLAAQCKAKNLAEGSDAYARCLVTNKSSNTTSQKSALQCH